MTPLLLLLASSVWSEDAWRVLLPKAVTLFIELGADLLLAKKLAGEKIFRRRTLAASL